MPGGLLVQRTGTTGARGSDGKPHTRSVTRRRGGVCVSVCMCVSVGTCVSVVVCVWTGENETRFESVIKEERISLLNLYFLLGR